MSTDIATKSNSNTRFELKFPANPDQRHAVEVWLVEDGLFLSRKHVLRKVNNIYFETPDWQSYSDNVDGLSRRVKTRLRWYGTTASGDVNARFEVKSRANSTGSKLVANVNLNFDELSQSDRLAESLQNLLGDEHRIHLREGSVPILYTGYEREYFESSDGIRMTIDKNLLFADPRRAGWLQRQSVVSAIDTVVEFKFSLNAKEMVVQRLNNFPLRAHRNSKYTIGIDHLYQ